jgi:hypothetical protein
MTGFTGPIPFDSQGQTTPGFTHSLGTAAITLDTGSHGVYEVTYFVQPSAGASSINQFGITVDGSLVSGKWYICLDVIFPVVLNIFSHAIFLLRSIFSHMLFSSCAQYFLTCYFPLVLNIGTTYGQTSFAGPVYGQATLQLFDGSLVELVNVGATSVTFAAQPNSAINASLILNKLKR